MAEPTGKRPRSLSAREHLLYAVELHAIADMFHFDETRTQMHALAEDRERLAARMARIESSELELMRGWRY